MFRVAVQCAEDVKLSGWLWFEGLLVFDQFAVVFCAMLCCTVIDWTSTGTTCDENLRCMYLSTVETRWWFYIWFACDFHFPATKHGK
jgi:hypothetical protein